MAETQFFKRENFWLQEYKNNFKLALIKAKTVKLFSYDVLEFLEKWLEKQTSYIPREDVDNFLPNMNLIFMNKKFYDFSFKRLEVIKNNWSILEYSFNLISELNEVKKDFEKVEERKNNEEKLKNDELKSKKEDDNKLIEMEEILKNI